MIPTSCPRSPTAWCHQIELEVFLPPGSRPFPQSCSCTQMPKSSPLPLLSLLLITMHLPSSLPATHLQAPCPLQLAQQVVQEQIAMGKDRGYLAQGPLYLKLSSKAEMSWFAFSHWSMQSSWGMFLVTQHRLLWFALRPSLGLQQLWKHLYATHLTTSFR